MNGVCHIIEEEYDVDVEEMWKVFSNFTSMEKFGVPDEKLKIKGEGIGCIRCFEWENQPVEHRLLAKVDETHFLAYDALMAIKPFNNSFMTTIQLDSVGEKKTRFRWYITMKFEDKELGAKVMVGLHTHHLNVVKKWVEEHKNK